MEEKQIGAVTHYFNHLSVAVIKIVEGSLAVGDTIHIKGNTSDFTQKVESMQIEHEDVAKIEAGESVAIKVIEHVREHDKVYKVADETE